MNEREKSQKNQDLATACARSRDLILLGLALLLHEISNLGERTEIGFVENLIRQIYKWAG